ncbi:MAG: PP2C family protein-serine/threonine phosphatase, partial [Limisphaerales bacterium]
GLKLHDFQNMDLATFESVELSDVGRRRHNNEDACLRLPELGIYCVADGMGGVLGGDKASEAVTNTLHVVAERLRTKIQPRLVDRVALVKAAVNQANKWIREFAAQKVIIGQTGTTLVAVIFDPRNPTRAVALHAGDSRLYRFKGGRLEQLTSDHTTAAALAARLDLSPSSLPMGVQNELTRAVGLKDQVELEQTLVQVHSGDLFLLCSDGLTRMVPDAVIAGLLNGGAEQPMAALAEGLITRANDAGGKDNITVVLIRVPEISAADISAQDDDWETAATPDLSSSDIAPIVAVSDPGAISPADTPLFYEGETPTTDEPTPTRH